MRYMISFIALIFTASCGLQEGGIRVVSPEVYGDIKLCWNGEKGFSAYMVKESREDGFTVYFISPYCKVEENGNETTFNYINSIGIYSDKGAFSRYFGADSRYYPNTTVDSRTNVVKEVYLFKGSIEAAPVDGIENTTIFNIKYISTLNKLDVNFDSFIKMSGNERYKIFLEKMEN